MINFDVEVFLNIYDNEVIVGIVLIEESFYWRNIIYFGFIIFRLIFVYGMFRFCDFLFYDIIVDLMCGIGVILIEGVIEWFDCFYIVGDNNLLVVNRVVNNIVFLLIKS